MATAERELSGLISEIGLDKQNRATLGRLVGYGGLAHAVEVPDGRMSAQIRIPPDQLAWDSSILVLPHGGDLDLELVNDDTNTHCALLPATATASGFGFPCIPAEGPRSTWTGGATTASARMWAMTRAEVCSAR